MNLGQLIGELRMAIEPADDGQKKRISGKGSKATVLAFLRAQADPISSGTMAKALGITPTHASVVLRELFLADAVTRTGEPRHYLYIAMPTDD